MQHCAMLTRLYIEALLVNEYLADQVYEALIAGEIDEAKAFLAWDGPISRAESNRPPELACKE